MCKLRAGLVQGLLGEFAVCYVLKSADEQRAALDLGQDTGHAVNVFHDASRGKDSEHKVDLLARNTARDYSVERRKVLGMDHIPDHQHRDLGRWVELEDTEGLLGPVVLVRLQVGDKAAGLTQPLGFGETKIGLLDLRLRSFSIVNVCCRSVPADDLALFVF